MRRELGVARLDAELLWRKVEFLGGDLAECRQDALAELDLAGLQHDDAIRLEGNPPVEARIVDEALRQRVGDHAAAPARIAAAARSTASTIRRCAPQRHRCGSSAALISSREGAVLRASKEAAEIWMPERQ